VTANTNPGFPQAAAAPMKLADYAIQNDLAASKSAEQRDIPISCKHLSSRLCNSWGERALFHQSETCASLGSSASRLGHELSDADWSCSSDPPYWRSQLSLYRLQSWYQV